MTGLDDDRELDDFLARRSMLHRRLADRDRADPPPDLDRLVLDKAREAIQTPQNLPVHRAPRWAVPVALAASLVIAFTVVLHMAPVGRGDVQLASSASATADAAARVAETGESPEAERSTATGVGANQLRIQMEKRAASPGAPPMVAFDAKASAPNSALATDSQRASEPRGSMLAAASAPAADAASSLADRAGASSSAASGDGRSSEPALAKSRAPAPAVAMPHAVAKASGAAEAPQTLVASNVPQRGAAGLEPTSAPRSAYAPAPGERRAIIPAKSEMTASNTVSARAERESSTPTAALQASDSAVVAQVPPAAPPLAQASASSVVTGPTNDARSSAGAAASAEAKHANPQVWLREIEALRAAGKTDEANRQLAEFRKTFPNEAAKLPPTRDSRPVQ
jgi:hypothetical protein